MPFMHEGRKYYFKKKTAQNARRKGEVIVKKANGLYFIKKRQ